MIDLYLRRPRSALESLQRVYWHEHTFDLGRATSPQAKSDRAGRGCVPDKHSLRHAVTGNHVGSTAHIAQQVFRAVRACYCRTERPVLGMRTPTIPCMHSREIDSHVLGRSLVDSALLASRHPGYVSVRTLAGAR